MLYHSSYWSKTANDVKWCHSVLTYTWSLPWENLIWAWAPNEDSNHPVHPHSLIRASGFHLRHLLTAQSLYSRMRLSTWEGSSEYLPGIYSWRPIFSWRDSYNIVLLCRNVASSTIHKILRSCYKLLAAVSHMFHAPNLLLHPPEELAAYNRLSLPFWNKGQRSQGRKVLDQYL